MSLTLFKLGVGLCPGITRKIADLNTGGINSHKHVQAGHILLETI
jgi:hypothetical protein